MKLYSILSKSNLSLIAFLLFSVLAFSQNLEIKGIVLDSSTNTPLPGVSVIVKNTSIGVSTDFDGNFLISNRKIGDVLVFSFMGFANQEVTITGKESLKIQLQEDAQSLDEVVVVGYGTQKKSHLTGAISKVVNEDLDQIAVARVDDALVGQVSGVNKKL